MNTPLTTPGANDVKSDYVSRPGGSTTMGGQFAKNATTCPNFPEIFTAAIFDTAMMESRSSQLSVCDDHIRQAHANDAIRQDLTQLLDSRAVHLAKDIIHELSGGQPPETFKAKFR
ncbi:hypothetical protein E4U11_008278 [Claviceps purpurea]|nr:hypothetical protein E4U11_008278 [Claviceps purpurea]